VSGKTARKVSTRPATARKPATPAPSATGKGSWRQARFTGAAGTRAYRVYVPTGLGRKSKVPMLLALHGCGQNALDFAAGTRFNDLADKHKIIVVYPEQGVTHNGQRCWNWFRSGHQFRAQGEPAIFAGIVRRVSQDTAKWRIDTERIYVAGISAGGAMAVVLAATYPELFAAVGVHSGVACGAASSPVTALKVLTTGADTDIDSLALQAREHTSARALPLPLCVIHGDRDNVVAPRNAVEVVHQYLVFNGRLPPAAGATDALPAADASISTSLADGRTMVTDDYRVDGRVIARLVRVTGLGHAWSGGDGAFAYNDPHPPDATALFAEFFTLQLRGGT